MPSQGFPGKCLLLGPTLNAWLASQGSGSRSIISILETHNPGFIVLEKAASEGSNTPLRQLLEAWKTDGLNLTK